jgi:hypothetical protein
MGNVTKPKVIHNVALEDITPDRIWWDWYKDDLRKLPYVLF